MSLTKLNRLNTRVGFIGLGLMGSRLERRLDSFGWHIFAINRNVLLDVLPKTTVIAQALVGKIRKIKDNDYSPEFPPRLMSKDMNLVMDAAGKSGADLPASSVAQSVLASLVLTSGDLDLAAIRPFVLGQGTRVEV
jgi:3-hydroxyisobutyrate dehydrogenase